MVKQDQSNDAPVTQESSRVSKARERTQARFKAFLSPDGSATDSSKRKNDPSKLSENLQADRTLEDVDSHQSLSETTPDSNTDAAAQRRKQKRKDKLKDLGKSSRSDIGEENVSPSQTQTERKSRNKRRPRSRTDDELAGESLIDKQSDDDDGANLNDAYENSQPEEVIQQIINNAEEYAEEQDLSSSKEATAERFVRALQQKRKDDGLLLCINIHKCDQLKADVRILHPLVEVHLVDMSTGQYVKKSSQDRNVTSFYENAHDSVDYILPLMTQPCDFRKNKSLLPRWEEVLIYNEIYSYFLQRDQGDPEVLIMFEILDFLSMPVANKANHRASDKGWYHVAWGFLKLVSAGGALNTDKKLRLQLYQPVTKYKRKTDLANPLQIFRWWQTGVLVPYPSTLYVTVKGVRHPESVDPSNRSMFATQEEKGTINFAELDSALEPLLANQKKKSVVDLIWSKLPGQPSRIPNNLMAILPAGRNGCTTVKFSYSGRFLACGCAGFDANPILVYEIPSGKLVGEFLGHAGVIYDLCWSPNDNELLSSSSDGSVRSWDARRYTNHAIKVFPHPKYVYTARYHPMQPRFVVSGGYDHVVRVWNKANEGLHAEILRTLIGHAGFVNSVCFTTSGHLLYTGDSNGMIIEWSTSIGSNKESKRKVSREVVESWQLLRQIAVKDLAGVEISCMQLHVDERKLLVQARDSLLRMVDLRSLGIMCTYAGSSNFQQRIRCTMSPCGGLTIAGSEDGIVLVWNTETGSGLYTYTEYRFVNAVMDVDFHPHDNLLVMCSYGDGHPVHVYSYDASKAISKSTINLVEKDSGSRLSPVEAFNGTKAKSSHAPLNDVQTAADSYRMNQIRQTLSSVTTFLTDCNAPSMTMPTTQSRVTFDASTLPAGQHRNSIDATDLMSTWGSDFDPSYTRNATAFETLDNPMSPLTSEHLGSSSRFASLQQQQQQERYLSVAKSRSSRILSSSIAANRGRTTSTDELQVSSNAPIDRKGISHEAVTPQVISLYQYKAQREDELSFLANEVIIVVQEENENWSFGRLQDGSEGFFPLNYVAAMESHNDSDAQQVTRSEQHSAIIGKDGDLKILSGPEESDGSLVEILKSDRGKRGKTSRKKLRDIQR